jgi:hypothetical protein
VDIGEAVKVAPFVPFDQTYVVPPLAVKVVLVPKQMLVFPVIDAVGS